MELLARVWAASAFREASCACRLTTYKKKKSPILIRSFMNMKTERFSNFTPKGSKIVSLACMDVIHLIFNIVGYLKEV